MAFTTAEETVLKALASKLIARIQIRQGLVAKKLSLDNALNNFKAALDAAKVVEIDGNEKRESVSPEVHASILATHKPIIAAIEADIANDEKELRQNPI